MTRELDLYLREALKPTPLPSLFGGRFIAVSAKGGRTLGYANYSVVSQRGRIDLGALVYSNQWQEYAWVLPPGAPLDVTRVNQAIVAEIYVALREINRQAGLRTARQIGG